MTVLCGQMLIAESALAQAGPEPDEDPADESAASGSADKGDSKTSSEGPNLKKTTTPGANQKKAKAGAKTPAKAPSSPWGAIDGIEPTPAFGGPDVQMQPDWNAATSPDAEVSYPWIEHHGYLRVRADLFHNFDLGTYRRDLSLSSSPVPPPLTEEADQTNGQPGDEEASYNQGANSQAGANMRLRYMPTIHVSKTLRINTVIDIMDNLVLGSTPDGGTRYGRPLRADAPIEFTSDNQRPIDREYDGRDDVQVKQLWGEWVNPLGTVLVGRTPRHWGLGMMWNNGYCLDCNYGDNVDTIMAVANLFDTYLSLSWDFPAEGATSFSGLDNYDNQQQGQPFDLDNRDDAFQWTVALFNKPLSRSEKEVRNRALNVERKSTFDWGVLNIIRRQGLTSELSNPDEGQNTLRDVKAFMYTPDVWLKYQYNPKPGVSYRLEFEGALNLGQITEYPNEVLLRRDRQECLDNTIDTANIDDCPSDQVVQPRERNIQQWGYALEFDHRIKKFQWGIRHGAASGDDRPIGFGVLDDASVDVNDLRDDSMNAFLFDRDYIVDLILFREIIGSVTNAAYFKPYLQYDFVYEPELKEFWGFSLGAMYAFALDPDATPGQSRPLGLEFDLEFYITEVDRFRWSLAYGLMFPFSGFDLLDPQDLLRGVPASDANVLAEPSAAQTIQMNLGIEF